MGVQEEDAHWAASDAELERWQAAGHVPRFFLRDDDAVSHTPALDRLARVCAEHRIPLLLACIPAHCGASLGKFMRANPSICGAAHGYAHLSHAPIGQKPCELGTDRPLDIVLAELVRGREHLLDLFGGRLSGLLVPPWNRIEEPVVKIAAAAGFSAISVHGWSAPGPGLPFINTHVDIIHWSGGRKGRESAWLSGEIARNLSHARNAGWRAVGILTHHLVHDDAAWRGLDAISARFGSGRAQWIAADDLVREAHYPPPVSTQA